MRDQEALTELKKATDFLVAQPRFSFKARIFYDVIQDDGRRLQFEKTGEIILQRPNRLYVESRHDDGVLRKLWYQGEELSIADLSKNLHTQVKAPSNLDETLDMLEGLIREPQPLADLLYSDLSHLEEHAIEANIVGDSLLDGQPCLHLAFRGETLDWQIWVEQSDTPFIRKVALSYREFPGHPQYVALINDWTTPEQFSDEIFQFTVPQGSQWIKVLTSRTGLARNGGQP
ncbi:MAG: DUF2092 domain-containing protein [Deltaproteobacteria bacterium]|nr:DUF2092 domain-containing protein [Deltaproteobacteria bacterium]